ncbi:hypothetical protein AB2762_13075 [Acinetobacter indicus]
MVHQVNVWYAMHNLMHIMALYASSDELEEVFIKPLFAKALKKSSIAHYTHLATMSPLPYQ